jgi:hypothetical protein
MIQLATYPKEVCTHSYCSTVHSNQDAESASVPSTEDWIKKMWDTYSVLSFVPKWKGLEDIVRWHKLEARRQVPQFSFICGSLTNIYVYWPDRIATARDWERRGGRVEKQYPEHMLHAPCGSITPSSINTHKHCVLTLKKKKKRKGLREVLHWDFIHLLCLTSGSHNYVSTEHTITVCCLLRSCYWYPREGVWEKPLERALPCVPWVSNAPRIETHLSHSGAWICPPSRAWSQCS